jgi:hypothetical protein
MTRSSAMSKPSETHSPSLFPAPFQIGAEGINAEAIVNEIKAAVPAKMKARLYSDARIARAERSNLRTLSQDESLFELYLECPRSAPILPSLRGTSPARRLP